MRQHLIVRDWIEYLGGARDEAPAGWPTRWSWLILGLWWGLAIAGIACFCGQTSKFIYIDF